MDSANKPNPANNYVKYSGLAFQLLGGIGLSGWLGYLLDQYLQVSFPVFMLVFGFIFFVGMMYQLYRTINKP
jgi:F0F1-type ATP synthase assembly protein I